MVTWVIQSNGVSTAQVLPFVEACNKLGIAFEDVGIIPFSEELPTLKTQDDDLVPYGSTTFMKLAHAARWPHLFYDPLTFNVLAWNLNRDDMLNQDARIMRIQEAYEFFGDGDWFIRPIDDFKAFAGQVLSGTEIRDWIDKASAGGYTFDDNKYVAVSTPKTIASEYRFFVVSGEVVDGSLYRVFGHVHAKHLEHDTPEERAVYDTAQALANKWLPHQHCVMDVGYGDFGIRVIEFNCLNMSGIYKHDVEQIVKHVTGAVVDMVMDRRRVPIEYDDYAE